MRLISVKFKKLGEVKLIVQVNRILLSNPIAYIILVLF